MEKYLKVVGRWGFYSIKLDYFGKVLKCIELSGTSKKGKCIELNGTEGVPFTVIWKYALQMKYNFVASAFVSLRNY